MIWNKEVKANARAIFEGRRLAATARQWDAADRLVERIVSDVRSTVQGCVEQALEDGVEIRQVTVTGTWEKQQA